MTIYLGSLLEAAPLIASVRSWIVSAESDAPLTNPSLSTIGKYSDYASLLVYRKIQPIENLTRRNLLSNSRALSFSQNTEIRSATLS